jgi:hypothetical protein
VRDLKGEESESGTLTVTRMSSGKPQPLRADPGGPYSTPRAEPMKLDGSGSTPAKQIKRYDWTFRQWPGKGCHPRQPLRRTNASGAKPTIVALCGLIVRLKVTDRGGHTDVAATQLTVERRAGPFAETPVAHREQPLQDPARQHALTPDERPPASRTDGVNASDCAPSTGRAALRAAASVLCPYVKTGGDREGHGYEIAQVHDRNGPFDRFWYVSTTDLSLRRVALYNPWMRPDGRPLPSLGITWFAFNQSQGRAVAEWWAALRAHEGMGLPTQPDAGHTGAFASAIKQGDDPRREIEPLIALNRDKLVRFVNKRLDAAETSLFQAAADPLPVIWQGWLVGLLLDLHAPVFHKVGGPRI